MHIPDGYLSPSTCAVMYSASAPFWYVALKKVRRRLHTRLVPRLALFSAFAFVVMMFNIPLPGGTSGHATGVGLATIVLGPWAGILAISTALLIQALFFGDGGITAFGANSFNMAIAGCLVTYATYRVLLKALGHRAYSQPIAGGLAAYVAINVSAVLTAIEFGIQPLFFRDAAGNPLYAPFPIKVALPAMLLGHLTVAGLAELFLTAGVIAYLNRTSPGLVPIASSAASLTVRWKPALIALAMLIVLSPLGLLTFGQAWGEWSAKDFEGTIARAQIQKASKGAALPKQAPAGLQHLEHLWPAPIRNYSPGLIGDASAGYLVSAITGVSVVTLLIYGLNALFHKRRRERDAQKSA